MSAAGSGAMLRVLKVLVAYAVGAGLGWMAIPAVRRTFLLPPLFEDVARGFLLAGAVLAAVVAWRYPEMGVGGREGRGGGQA